jgi:hypothetical protein
MADKDKQDELVPHSPLVNRKLTTIEPQGIAFFEREGDAYTHKLPDAFAWAAEADPEELQAKEQPWKRFVFAGRQASGPPSLNDFLVQGVGCDPSEDQARSVSKTLCQLLASRRSKLFGLSLADRFVNVMLPHAFLAPVPDDGTQSRHVRECAAGSWILQPLVSLIRVGRDGKAFRRMYSLTLFLIPVNGPDCEAREMHSCEIARMVNAGWGLASSPWPAELPPFSVSGPLPGYISRLDPSALPGAKAGQAPEAAEVPAKCAPLTLRQAAETIMFAVALRMARGPMVPINMPVDPRIGDDVVTSLGNSRVSSVVVVDKGFDGAGLEGRQDGALPGSLGPLMGALAAETRVTGRRKYRLDRAFFDQDDYAIGVLPSNNCMVITADPEQQRGRWESALMQAGWIAYMVIGATTASGTIRSIYRDLERVKRSEPTQIADIESEVVVDLNEIYDLDITWDAYRRRYRRLRDLLGITSDYDALQCKLQALYWETEVRFEAKTQERLTNLTRAIVALSLILVVLGIVTLGMGR